MSPLLAQAQALAPEIVSIRRDLHKNPELGFAEHRTAQLVADYLTKLGLVPRIMANTGVVATISGQRPGKTIALRADMDALPITEQADHEYVSTTTGLMHACGHDGHTAILLGAAKLLATNNDFPGNVKLIFQPAEEGPGGAMPLINEGVLENPTVDAIFGLHLGTFVVHAGQIALREGPVCAAPDTITIVVRGKGGHGAHPHLSVDAVVAAGHVIVALQTIVSREIDPLSAVVLSLGTINGGYRENVIADEVIIKGTVRTLSPEIRATMPMRIERVIRGTCESLRAEYTFSYEMGYPVLINDRDMTNLAEKVSQRVLGPENTLRATHPSMGGEDFSYFAERVPACFFYLGALNAEKGCHYPIHHPKFNFDEDAIPVGMAMLAEICLEYLQVSATHV
ncbi:MAG: amidohydrolase [Peptococcaceae bacterium]|nr:amidohydrolase [Peptococcaceae bacterium]